MKAFRIQIGVALFLLAALLGCSQNPYPQDGKLLTTEPEAPPLIPPPFVLDVPLQLELVEGASTEIVVRAAVPKPGTAVVTFKDLPAGAVFDPDTMKLTWTPSFEAGNESDPHMASRSYQVTANLRSSADSVTTIQRVMNLVVKDSPRAFTVTVEKTDIEQKEGEQVKIPLRISSEDFPQGVFRVLGLQIPSGAEIRETSDPSLFHLVYSADYYGTTTNDYSSGGSWYKPMKANVAVELPSGRMATLAVNWDLWDVRLDPEVNAPTNLSAGLDVNFAVAASDLNGETEPRITFSPPAFGKLKVGGFADAASKGNVSTVKSVRWTEIPAEQIGKTSRLEYKVCVKSGYSSFNRCVNRFVDVTFNPDQYPVPEIDRKQWPLGLVQYVKEGASLTVPLVVLDKNSSQPKVELFPKEIQDEVSWSKNVLTVTPKKAGFRQFNIQVTSAYGMKSQESFLLEILPSSWSEVLILGESQKVSELVKTGSLFDDAQYANPMLQPLDRKLLALRKLLVVTTSALKDPGALPEIELAAASVPNIFIMSPLGDQFGGSLATELKDLKVGFLGRFLAQTGMPELKLFSLIAETDSDLKAPVFPIHLGEVTSDESKSPLILKLDAASTCKTLLTLRKEDIADVFPLTVLCPRVNGGRLMLSGFEWADAVPAASDQKILKEWMTKLVKP